MSEPVKKRTTRRPSARRQRRKIHMGRMAIVLSVIALLVIILMAIISRSCSEEWGTRAGGDFRPAQTEALQAGRRDAAKVLDTHPGSMERQNALFEIKAREGELREAGHAHAADDYINAATDYLKTHGIKLDKSK